ncbi:MAG: hypothetical protein H6585_01580 [Flavobacteriales bacterium]|nr:hypothetical protein [Flavobacteriales bacterium]MCB9447019.1 hypothetical protein [Flavobacteriales bacterium]
MTEEQTRLWTRIHAFEIDDDTSEFTFTDRLARENGWPLEYAIRTTEEYKKFIFLLCITDHPLTPSDQVDQAWHLHLIYTRSYWIDMCKNLLGRDIHHGPTKGGQAEKDKYNDWYAETKKRYAEVFKDEAPEDIWPSSKIRFGELNFTRVNRHRNWVLPKPTFKLH